MGIIQFPEVVGSNLMRERVRLPQDLKAEHTLVLIAFYQPQQEDVNSWLPFVRSLEDAHPNFTYLELPVIRSLGSIPRWFINEGMRAGIGDPYALQRTVTLYLDKSAFRRHLGLHSEEIIHALLLDRSGTVCWRETGLFSVEKGAALLAYIQPASVLEER